MENRHTVELIVLNGDPYNEYNNVSILAVNAWLYVWNFFNSQILK